MFRFCFLILLYPHLASARIFDISKESFGTYLRGSFTQSTVGKSPYENSSGSGVSFDKEFSNYNSYEFGFIYMPGVIGWRFGFEVLQSPELKDINGTDVSATSLYLATSSFSVAIPKFGFEVAFKSWRSSRLFFGAEYGLGNLTLQNAYLLTAAGGTAFPTVSSQFREELKASASVYSAHFAYETLMSDSTTFCVDLGYRYLVYSEMSYNSDGFNNFQGTPVKGGLAKQNDNTTLRSLNLSGPYAAVSFRIWVK